MRAKGVGMCIVRLNIVVYFPLYTHISWDAFDARKVYSISHTQKIMHYLHEDKCIKHDKPIYTLKDILRKV